jgi:hypothetical protein
MLISNDFNTIGIEAFSRPSHQEQEGDKYENTNEQWPRQVLMGNVKVQEVQAG